MIRVLHVIPSVSLKHGGPSYAIKAFAAASKTAGIETLIATTDDDGGAARMDVLLGTVIERDGIQHIFFRRDFLPYKISFSLRRWLGRHVREFDLVHIHALFSFSSLAAGRAARKRGVPYIVRPLGVLSRWGIENRRPLLKRLWMRFIELPLLRYAAAVHYTTDAEREEANALYPALAGLASFIVPIPVEMRDDGKEVRAKGEEAKGEEGSAFVPRSRDYVGQGDWQWGETNAELRKGSRAGSPTPNAQRRSEAASGAERFVEKFPKARGRRIILFLSRLDRKKGVELLLLAFADVKRREANALLVIAGSGDERYVATLRKLAGDLKISDDVLWTGYLGPDEKSDAFAAATVFVLPSYSENFGIVAAEALAAGVPTILSDQVAIARDAAAANAAMVIPCDADEIAKAVLTLLRDVDRRTQIAERGRNFATQQFSAESVGEALREVYRKLVSEKSTA